MRTLFARTGFSFWQNSRCIHGKEIDKTSYDMTDEQRQRIANITNANKQIGEIYALMDELGLKYSKTTCSKCRRDLLNILREEAGQIEDASAESAFDAADIDWSYDYEYIYPRKIWWHGHEIGPDTPREIVEAFVRLIPQGYYRKVERQAEEIQITDTNLQQND